MDIRPHKRIVLPLDTSDVKDAIDTASDLAEHIGVLKIGLQLFIAAGPTLLKMADNMGAQCFLDLKLHDIPNTVAGAVRSAAEHKVDFLTVHASGGRKMLEAAAKAQQETRPDMVLLAVTLLTSIDAKAFSKELLHSSDSRMLSDDEFMEEYVVHMAKMAWESGVRGMVCSPKEVKAVRAALPDAILVVPGVRPTDAELNDQARVATPEQAMEDGANYLVIGRPITEAKDPVKAARDIAESIRPFT